MQNTTRLFLIFILGLTSCSLVSKKGTGPVSVPTTSEEWAALSQPSDAHKQLETLKGKWDVQVSFWSKPQDPPQVSTGHSDIQWILGGRFLEERFTGLAGSQAFEGLGIYGYDNALRRYSSIWTDSLNTAVVTAYGELDLAKQEISFEGDVYDPLIASTKKVQTVLKVVSNDEFSVVLFDETATGQRFKAVQMAYKRSNI